MTFGLMEATNLCAILLFLLGAHIQEFYVSLLISMNIFNGEPIIEQSKII
jgi:hypothetical protein